MTYDSGGRLQSVAYPSGLTVGAVYNVQGYFQLLANGVGASAIWTPNTLDASFGIIQESYGNGMVNAQTFVPQTERIASIGAVSGSIGAAAR